MYKLQKISVHYVNTVCNKCKQNNTSVTFNDNDGVDRNITILCTVTYTSWMQGTVYVPRIARPSQELNLEGNFQDLFNQ